MNVIIFPRFINTYEEGPRKLDVACEEHSKIITKLNENMIYPLISNKPPPRDQNDLPNKNGVIIIAPDEEEGTLADIYPINEWEESKPVFGVVFYNFETNPFKLNVVADILYNIIFGDKNLDDYFMIRRSYTNLFDEGYLKPPSLIKSEECSNTWTGTKVIRPDGVEYKPDLYPKEFIDSIKKE